jgi:hypothetical protein
VSRLPPDRHLVCFEFRIWPVEGLPEWVRIQGSGGLFGSGAAHVSADRALDVCARLLGRLRGEVAETLEVLVRSEVAHRPPLQRVQVLEVDGCRPVWAPPPERLREFRQLERLERGPWGCGAWQLRAGERVKRCLLAPDSTSGLRSANPPRCQGCGGLRGLWEG